MKRALSSIEKSVIARIAEMLSKNLRAQLLQDLANASAEVISPERVMFHIAGYERPPYDGQHSFGVAGQLSDSDGTRLNLDLYADQNDRLLELELIREGTGSIMSPNWDTLELF